MPGNHSSSSSRNATNAPDLLYYAVDVAAAVGDGSARAPRRRRGAASDAAPSSARRYTSVVSHDGMEVRGAGSGSMAFIIRVATPGHHPLGVDPRAGRRSHGRGVAATRFDASRAAAARCLDARVARDIAS